jgi:hypothetical protein
MAWVFPLLRKSADVIVETTVPVTEVADALVAAVLPSRHESPDGNDFERHVDPERLI